MNFHSLQIRQKLILGFGIILAVVALSGMILLTGLFNINKSSHALHDEQIPALAQTYKLQNHWQRAVFNLRSFSSQKEEKYYILANHELKQAQETLNTLKSATFENNRRILNWDAVEKELNAFRIQARKSQIAAHQVDSSYETLDSAQMRLQKLSDNYLNLQYKKLKKDVDNSAYNHIIKRRVDKISLMNDIVTTTENLKITIGETNYRNDPSLLNNLTSSFDIIRMNVETILPMTTKKYDLEALNEILNQNMICETSLEVLKNNWLIYSKLNNHDFLNKGLSMTMDMAKKQENSLTQSSHTNLMHATNAIKIWWWSFILSLLIGIFLAWRISRSLSEPILELTKIASLQADGMLISIPETNRKDEVGVLIRSMKVHQEQTIRIVDGLTTIGSSLNDLIIRLKNRSQNLTEITNTQATSSQEITASVEEMQMLTENSSSEATKAATEMHKAKMDVEEYVLQNKETIDQMQQLMAGSAIISELASQTYILSVNASIEASRNIGEDSKGFGAIAQAMRDLAEQVKTAAEELNKVTEKGQKTSNKAITNLDNINKIISNNGDVLENLASLSISQNAEARQISRAIQQLNTETQSTAQMAEAMTDEAYRLSNHADELQEMLNFYQKQEVDDSTLPKVKQWEWAELFSNNEDDDKIKEWEEISSQ